MAEGVDQACGVRYHSTSENEGNVIRYDITKPLEQEIDGATSFKGEYDKRPVAVKRYARKEGDREPPEVEILRYINLNDSHSNVARYYCVQKDPTFWLIATELGQCSLYDYLKEPAKYPDLETDQFTILNEITQGLNALHSLKIAHRDIRPGSIILSYPDVNRHCRAMIEGFALSKLIPGDLGMSHKHHQRRLGWHAPEILNKLTTNSSPSTEDITDAKEVEREKRQQEMFAGDIFSLGCLFYYTLTEGSHPFGDVRCERDNNIKNQTYQVPFEKDLFKRYYGAQSLITSMIQRNPNKRPKISEVMNHPRFWTEEQILQFFEKASDHLQNKRADLKGLVNGLLGAICQPSQRNDWIVHVDQILVKQLNRRCGNNTQLNGQSVFDLLRAIRNSKHHHRDKDWSMEVQRLFDATNGGFCRYWLKKFPELLLQVWQTLAVLKDDPDFKTYYDGTLRKNSPANAEQ